MRIFVFLNFFCLQKNTFLTEFNGVFDFSCFAFLSKIILMGFSNFLESFLLQKNRFSMLNMKFPKVPKMPKMPTKILTAMGSYRDWVHRHADVAAADPVFRPNRDQRPVLRDGGPAGF